MSENALLKNRFRKRQSTGRSRVPLQKGAFFAGIRQHQKGDQVFAGRNKQLIERCDIFLRSEECRPDDLATLNIAVSVLRRYILVGPRIVAAHRPLRITLLQDCQGTMIGQGDPTNRCREHNGDAEPRTS